MTQLGELDLTEAAQQAAGNWREFPCFCWDRRTELDHPENWCIIYTHHRDSHLLDQSNAAAIDDAMEPFADADDPDVFAEHHRHWAVGWIDGYAIRVFWDGKITEAFRMYHELTRRLAEYPILNEEDYSRRELEATLQNISEAAWSLKQTCDLPDDWETAVYEWLSEHRPRAVENVDDTGGYPDHADLKAAFAALGYQVTV